MSKNGAVVLYDGECGFCNRSVQFIIKRDPNARFRFAALQSEVGKELAAKHGIDAGRLDGLVLIEQGEAFVKTGAALRIARRLSWPWPVSVVFFMVPRVVRDWFYDRFAKRRYRWFGRTESCSIPSAADRDRFLIAEK